MNRLQRLMREENVWTIAVRERGPRLLHEGDLSPFRAVPITSREWYADPLVFSWRGRDFVFCELYDRESCVGSIGVTELGSAVPDPPREVLSVGAHLSYPCVFEHAGRVYMVPESSSLGNVMLFRARRFPDDWVMVRELLGGGRWVDTTVIADGGRVQLLTFEMRGEETRPLLYEVEDLEAGRLSEGVRVGGDGFDLLSRGAGNLFQAGGRLLRPSQDGRLGYGHSLRFNEVEFSGGYGEGFVREVTPDMVRCDLGRPLIGVHTYGLTERFEIIDVKFDDPVFRHQVRRAVGYVRRRFG